MGLWSRPTIGLDIGSRVVKAVELKKAGKRIELQRFGVAPIYPDGEKPASADQQSKAIQRAIGAALEQAKISATQVVTAVAGESIIVRYIQLPEMPEEELKNALRWEAEEYIPFRVEDVNIDSAIIGHSGEAGSGRIDVLLVCARKDLIQEHISLIREAGLTPVTIDVDSFAFLNCYEINYQTDPNEVVGLVNIGGDITSISVYANGSPRFSRDISIGGSTVTTAIQQRLGVSPTQAESLKLQRGVSKAEPGGDANVADTIRSTVQAMTGEAGGGGDGDTALVDGTIRNTLSNLLGEIRRSIQFFENQSRGLSVGRLVIGGGTANLTGLDAYMNQELRLPVEMIDPLVRIPVTGGDIDAEALRNNKHMLSVGIGLALRKVVD